MNAVLADQQRGDGAGRHHHETRTRLNDRNERTPMGLFGAIFSGGDWDGWDTDTASEQGNLPGGDGGSAGQGGD